MKESTKIGIVVGGLAAVVLGVAVAKGKSISTTGISTTGISTTQSSTGGVSIALGLSTGKLISGNAVNISVVMTNGYGGSVVQIHGLPSALSITTDASAIGSTTVIINKVGTYTIYGTFGSAVSNKVVLSVVNQCSNNAQCAEGQICQNGKCVKCPPQTCPCGSLWSSSSCACATQTPGQLYFTDSSGAQESVKDYYPNLVMQYHSVTAVFATDIYGVCMAYNAGSSPGNCTGLGTCTGFPVYVYIPVQGVLLDQKHIPICNQTISLALGNATQINAGGDFTYTTSGSFYNGKTSVNVKTNSQGVFSTTVAFNVEISSYPSVIGGFSVNTPPTVPLIIVSTLTASYGNIPSPTLSMNISGNMVYCSFL